MMKRGISPLISIVLIIGVTIVIAVVVNTFIFNVTEDQLEEGDEAAEQAGNYAGFSPDCKNSHARSQIKITNDGGTDLKFILKFDDGALSDQLVNAYSWDEFIGGSSNNVDVTPVTIIGGEDRILSAQTRNVDCDVDRNEKALSFDGTGDYLTASNAGSLNVVGKELTVSAWVKANSFAGDHYVVSNDRDWANMGGYELRLSPVGPNHVISGGFWDSTGNVNRINGITPLGLNEWYHLALVLDNVGGIYLYLDGVEDGSSNGPDLTIGASTTPDFCIGCMAHAHLFNFDGVVDEVKIYERAFAPGEIVDLMTNKPAGDQPGLIGYWTMEQVGGGIVSDTTGYGNDATIVGDVIQVGAE
jgi:hypothetical protein